MKTQYGNLQMVCNNIEQSIKNKLRSSHCGRAEMNPTRNHEVVDSIPGLAQ